MAKISLLPPLNNPDGDETVPVVKNGRTMRADLRPLTAAAVKGAVDLAQAGFDATAQRASAAVLRAEALSGASTRSLSIAIADRVATFTIDDRLAGIENAVGGALMRWISAVRVRSDGHTIEVDVAAGQSAAALDVSRMALTVFSEGFVGTDPVIVERQVRVLGSYRKEAPDQLSPLVVIAGGAATLTLQLADFVFDDDRSGGFGTSGIDPYLQLRAGWAVAGGVSAGAQTIRVINGSTLDYPRAQGKWNIPPAMRFSDTVHVEAMGTAWGAGLPHVARRTLGGVRFDVIGLTSGVTASAVSTSIVASTWRTGPFATLGYEADISTAPLAATENARLRFRLYPAIGDDDAVFDSDSVAHPSALMEASVPAIVDKANTYGRLYVALAATGSDSTGVASAVQGAAEAAPFATLPRALWALQELSRTTLGRADLGNHRVLHMGGDLTLNMVTSVPGSPPAFSPALEDFPAPKTWWTMEPGTGANACRLLTGGAISDRMWPSMLRMRNIELVGSAVLNGSNVTAAAVTSLWLDGPILTGPVTNNVPTVFAWGFMYWTGGSYVNIGTAALTYYAGNISNNWCLVRGISGDNAGAARVHNFTGSTFVTGGLYADRSAGVASIDVIRPILGNLKVGGSNGAIIERTNGDDVRALFYNLEIETLQNTSRVMGWKPDGNTTSERDFHMYHCSVFGGRKNIGYADVDGAAGKLKTLHCLIGNVFFNLNHKDDTFPTANAARRAGVAAIGAHVGWYGNVILNGAMGFDPGGGASSAIVPGPTSWLGEFLNAREIVLGTTTGHFVDYRANSKNSPPFDGTGGSDFRPIATSPIANRLLERVAIPLTIEGALRGTAAGARAVAL